MFEKFLAHLTGVIFFCSVAADANLGTAAILPPEIAPPEEKAEPSEVAREPESSRHPENPFEEPANRDPYEAMKRKREMTIIYIILAVVLVFCIYWWTSGKLHHKVPQ